MTGRGRAAVFGADGQIGRESVRALGAIGFKTKSFARAQCDVTDAKGVAAALQGFENGDVVLNAVAYNDVARAEDDFAAALLTNGCAPYFLALAARERGAILVHFSTDYVFDGRKETPYVESDAVHPLNAYGRTKLCGEAFAAAAAPRHYLARVSTVFGAAGSARRENFVERVLSAARDGASLRLMSAGAISPTYAADAADIVAAIVDAGAPFGTYHVANSGACSWFDFAEAIARLSGATPKIERLEAEDTDKHVRRPLASALTSEKLSGLGLRAKPWQDGLRRYLQAAGRLAEG